MQQKFMTSQKKRGEKPTIDKVFLIKFQCLFLCSKGLQSLTFFSFLDIFTRNNFANYFFMLQKDSQNCNKKPWRREKYSNVDRFTRTFFSCRNILWFSKTFFEQNENFSNLIFFVNFKTIKIGKRNQKLMSLEYEFQIYV